MVSQRSVLGYFQFLIYLELAGKLKENPKKFSYIKSKRAAWERIGPFKDDHGLYVEPQERGEI